jgi:hypothetical protein
MATIVGRRALSLGVAFGLALPWLIGPPGGVSAVGCPAEPWTLASVVRVPSLWGELPSAWPPASVSRAGCFGAARISFVARGGLLNAVFPGVVMPASFGTTVYLMSGAAPASAGWDLEARVPAGIGMSAADLRALGMTSPGLGGDGWQEVWWRGSGHFDDPAAAGCRPDDGTSTIDGVPIVLTPAPAIELCRNEFVLDSFTRMSVPPTDTVADPGPAAFPVAAVVATGAFSLVVFGAVLSWPARTRRRR